MTYLCVPIFVSELSKLRRDVSTAIEAGAEMLELRLDTFNESPTKIVSVMQNVRIPWIATNRPTWEGGQNEGSDSERLGLLEFLSDAGAPYVDLELKSERINLSSKLILSSHDFQDRPERLHNLLLEMDQVGCDVQKVAWLARSVRDNLEAFEILQRAGKPTIALCMGEEGIVSRILAKKFGAFLTFASLNNDSATAAGQVTISDMKNLYRWEEINAKTKVYGVVAHPVGHSMSPAIHNAAFDEADYDGVYVPLLVNPGYESFKAFMESFVSFEGLDLCGLSVTLPHKENALRYLQEKGAKVEDLAARIGAVNTIIIDRANSSLSGINTDYAAILDSISSDRKALAGVPVAVIGAGGTGRTAVAALTHCGAKVTVYNRTHERAAALAAEFGAAAQSLEKLSASDCRIFVNTTSVGMHPDVDQSPFGSNPPKLGGDKIVFDTIYNPMKTKLLADAEAAGAKTINGVEMFVRQAAAQFTIWTNMPAPVDVMRKVIVQRLGG